MSIKRLTNIRILLVAILSFAFFVSGNAWGGRREEA